MVQPDEPHLLCLHAFIADIHQLPVTPDERKLLHSIHI